MKGEPANLRDLLEIRPAGAELAIEHVEPVDASYAVLWPARCRSDRFRRKRTRRSRGHEPAGGRFEHGEGGEDPDVYAPVNGAPSLLNSKIKQVASAPLWGPRRRPYSRRGTGNQDCAGAPSRARAANCRPPNDGADRALRHAQPGMQLISPPPHHDIYSMRTWRN